jgi:hypothetical protein
MYNSVHPCTNVSVLIITYHHIVCVNFFYFIPSPKYVTWTHHAFVISHMCQLIKPSSCVYLYWSVSIPTLTSINVLE